MLTSKPIEPKPLNSVQPGAFLFGIFLSCIVTSSLVFSTFSWILEIFNSNSTSFNHSVSSLYWTGLSQNLLQNSFDSSALDGTCVYLSFLSLYTMLFGYIGKNCFAYIGCLVCDIVSKSQILQKLFVSAPQ